MTVLTVVMFVWGLAWRFVARTLAVILNLFVQALCLPYNYYPLRRAADGGYPKPGELTLANDRLESGWRYMRTSPWDWVERIFGNPHDGMLGDKRGRWILETPFGLPVTHGFSRWWWAAIRNPANGLRRSRFFAADLDRCLPLRYFGQRHVGDRKGEAGWQFVYTTERGRPWRLFAGFYWVWMYPAWLTGRPQQKCIRVRLGFKLDPDDRGDGTPEQDHGFTTVIAPWKSVHQ